MYDYDRSAAALPKSYLELVKLAEDKYGVKPGHKLNALLKNAQELDDLVDRVRSLSPDDTVQTQSRIDDLWETFQKLHVYHFGYRAKQMHYSSY